MERKLPVRNFKQLWYTLRGCLICGNSALPFDVGNFWKFNSKFSLEWKAPEVYTHMFGNFLLWICDPVDPVSRIFWSNRKLCVCDERKVDFLMSWRVLPETVLEIISTHLQKFKSCQINILRNQRTGKVMLPAIYKSCIKYIVVYEVIYI